MSEGRVVGVGRDLDAAGYATEVPVGYRRTDVGVIPDDWEVVLAGDIGRFGSGSGFPVRYQGAAQGDHPFFKVSDMSRDGNELLLKECPNYITDDTRRLLGASLFPAQSITFAKVGAAVFLERKRILAQPSCVDNNMAAFELTDERADTLFAYYWLLSIRLSSFANTTALPSLSSTALCGLNLPLPNLPEQRAIAAVLSDVDELVEQLEALLAKKRAIKQASMQELLTGRTRLPGFRGDWGVGRVRDVLEPIPSNRFQVPTSAYSSVGRFPVIDQGKDPIVAFADCADKVFTPPTGGIIIFGDHTRIVKFRDSPFILGADGTKLLAARGNTVPKFLFHVLQATQLPNTGYNRHLGLLLGIGLLRPPPKEQHAIAAILSDMDAEITALEHRLDKTRAIKQGMMQQLLTGAIRLPIPDTVPHEITEP